MLFDYFQVNKGCQTFQVCRTNYKIHNIFQFSDLAREAIGTEASGGSLIRTLNPTHLEEWAFGLVFGTEGLAFGTAVYQFHVKRRE